MSAPQADLDRLGVAFSVSTHHDPPPRPSMTLREAQRDPRAFLVGFAQTERSVDFERELARRTWAAGRGVHADARHDWMAAAAPVERFGRALCEQRRLGTDTRWAALLKHVLGRSKPVASVSAEDEDAFDLTTIVAALRITPEKHVYLSWEPGRGEVDRLAFQDLADRFAWIWYASSAWLLFVHHSGKPSVVQWGG